jgi:hypothetical protein
MAIWQDLVDDHGFAARYASVRRFVVTLRGAAPAEARVVITTAPGEEGQVDYGGDGPMVRDPSTGKYRRVRFFVLTLGYSRKCVRLLPGLNFVLLARTAGETDFWALLLFVPGVNLVAAVLLWKSIAKRRGLATWPAYLACIPLVNIPALSYYAFSPASPAVTAPVPQSGPGFCTSCGAASGFEARFCGMCGTARAT